MERFLLYHILQLSKLPQWRMGSFGQAQPVLIHTPSHLYQPTSSSHVQIPQQPPSVRQKGSKRKERANDRRDLQAEVQSIKDNQKSDKS
ncbi:hypothetical protein Tco_0522157 [Tanacetum coccineum]